jgi:hypothetical protein
MNSPGRPKDTWWTCFQSNDRLSLNLQTAPFYKVVNIAQRGVKRHSAFNHVTFSGACHRRYSTGAANQVLQFAHEAIMFWIDKLLNRMKAYISEAYKDYVLGLT